MTEPTPRRNRIKCKACGDILESTHLHDYRACTCKATFIAGGIECPRVGWTKLDMIVRVLDDDTEEAFNWANSEKVEEPALPVVILGPTREDKLAVIKEEINLAVASLEKDAQNMSFLTAYDGLRLGYILQKSLELI